MPSTSEPMTDAELEAFETTRDLHADLLQSIREMKAGQTTMVHSPAIATHKVSGLSQSRSSH